MRVLMIIAVFAGCFLYDGLTRLNKAPLREIVFYTVFMLVSMGVAIFTFVKKVDIPSPIYAIENFIDLFFPIKHQ